MEIDFELGRIECGNRGIRIFEAGRSKRYAGFSELRIEDAASPGWKNPWVGLYAELAKCRTKGIVPSSSLASACEGMKIIDQIISH